MRRRPHLLSLERAAALRPLLDALDAALDRTARIAADPVERGVERVEQRPERRGALDGEEVRAAAHARRT